MRLNGLGHSGNSPVVQLPGLVSGGSSAVLERMLGNRMDDVRLRLGLALEYSNANRTEDGVRELRAYSNGAELPDGWVS